MDERTGPIPRLPRREAHAGRETMQQVRETLRGLRYGEVTVVVQDGVVIQLRRTEHVRLSPGETPPG